MRLSDIEAKAIKSIVHAADPHARVFLFGSRVDDSKSGGDIDLLVESGKIGFAEKISILAQIKMKIGDQKIDLTLTPSIAADTNPFILSIINDKIEL